MPIRSFLVLCRPDRSRTARGAVSDAFGIAGTTAAILHGAITWISAFVVVTLRLVGRTQERQRNGREARAEFPKRGSARDGLGQAFGSFIELVLQKLNAVEPAISQNALVTSWAVAVRITLLRDRFRL